MELRQLVRAAVEGVEAVKELRRGELAVARVVGNAAKHAGTLVDAGRVGNVNVLVSLLGPALRGFIRQRGKVPHSTNVPAEYATHFNWDYTHDQPELARLYTAAKQGQWDGNTALDWSTSVDPHDDAHRLIDDGMLPLNGIASYRALPRKQQELQRMALVSWLLSQFLHGEQGALFAACQVTESVQWLDGKFYGSTQVMDEGRHVEVFHRYLSEKLGRIYQINDNLYVLIDALMSDSNWDVKFLGMQILVEGVALGAFGTLRNSTHEPLLRELLKYVITDEARHVHFGVVALGTYYRTGLSPSLLKEREDWAFEMCLLLRNRFLAHEFHEEYYAHEMSRAEWERILVESGLMQMFRRTMFKRIMPNLRRINLLSERIRPHYEALGLLEYEHGKAAPELSVDEMLV